LARLRPSRSSRQPTRVSPSRRLLRQASSIGRLVFLALACSSYSSKRTGGAGHRLRLLYQRLRHDYAHGPCARWNAGRLSGVRAQNSQRTYESRHRPGMRQGEPPFGKPKSAAKKTAEIKHLYRKENSQNTISRDNWASARPPLAAFWRAVDRQIPNGPFFPGSLPCPTVNHKLPLQNPLDQRAKYWLDSLSEATHNRCVTKVQDGALPLTGPCLIRSFTVPSGSRRIFKATKVGQVMEIADEQHVSKV
jgi:hypothetical protein